MPFQSEKQRRYMHANLPDIAKRWERDYSNGGIAELNAELNSLPEYYMPFPAAQGGRIPLSWGSGGLFGETIKWENLTEDQKKLLKYLKRYTLFESQFLDEKFGLTVKQIVSFIKKLSKN